MKIANSPGPASPLVTDSTLALKLFFIPLARSAQPPERTPCASLLDSLYLALAQRLAIVCLPLLTLEYALFRHARGGFFGVESSSTLYQEFLARLRAGEWEELLTGRPVLDRLVKLTIDHWRATATELFERLAHDGHALSVAFGVTSVPTQVRLGVSDPHNGGRTAAILSFANGRRLLYKPKNLSPDRAWHEFALWLKANSAPWHPLAPTILERHGYGWTSFVETHPCESPTEQRAFFNNLGCLLALLHLLGATDCHRENIISHGTEPVLVDLETLLQPRPKQDPMSETLRESVLAVEILPCRYIGAGQQEIYFPGFDGEWESNKFTGMSAVSPSLSLRKHVESFSAGFAAMYEFLLQHKERLPDLDTGPLAAFRDCGVRYIHRPTMTYAITLRRALRHLDAESSWSLPFEKLQRFDSPGMSDDVAATLRAAEHAALERLDIPFFMSRSDATDLYWENGGRLADFFDEPALELARQRAARLSLSDLAFQLELIHQALGGTRP